VDPDHPLQEGEELMNDLIDIKIVYISGKLASILEELSGMTYALHAGQDIQPSINRLIENLLATDPQWFQNASLLLKELYNRRQGP
jgi:hypothetical protein